MIEGMLYRNEEGLFYLEEEIVFTGGESLSILDEDTYTWVEGKVEKDEFNEYYFTDGFLVSYLYEGLPVRYTRR